MNGGVLSTILRAIAAKRSATGLWVSSAMAAGPFDELGDAATSSRHLRWRPDLGPQVDHEDDGLAGAVAASSVMLGDDDRDVEVPMQAFALGLAETRPRRRRKLRRLDTLFDGSGGSGETIDAVFIGEPSVRSLAILRGGDRILRQHRPWLVVPDGSDAPFAAVMQQLEAHGYRAFDTALRPRAAQTVPRSASWLLAVPGEHPEPAVMSQPRDDAVGRAITLSLDGELASWGFHQSKADDDWRWIGPRPRAGLVLPAWRGTLRRVDMRVSTPASHRNLDAVAVSLDGQVSPVTRQDTGAGITTLTVRAPDTLRWQPFHRLALSFPDSLERDGDSRRTALAISSVELHYAVD